MVAGAVVLAPSALAGFSVDADREASVSVASDPNAILGIDNESNIKEVKDGAVQIATLTNRLGESAAIDVRVVEIPGVSNDILSASPDSTDVADGTNVSATVECNQQENVNEQKSVVFGVSANGPTVSVTDATFTVPIEKIKCKNVDSQPSNQGVSVTNVTANEQGQSQIFKYELNEDMAASETLTITVIDPKKLNYDDSAYTSTPAGSVNGSSTGKNYVITFSPDQDIAAGNTIEITATVDADRNADNQSPYDVEFNRGDGVKSTQFYVASG